MTDKPLTFEMLRRVKRRLAQEEMTDRINGKTYRNGDAVNLYDFYLYHYRAVIRRWLDGDSLEVDIEESVNPCKRSSCEYFQERKQP